MHHDLTEFARDLESFIQDCLAISPTAGQPSPSTLTQGFQDLALRLFQLQRRLVPAYACLCQAQNLADRVPTDWREIPRVPTAAFKEFELTSLIPVSRDQVFRSSGTTAHSPARHFHDRASLRVYETSLLAWFRPHLLIGTPTQLVALTPSPEQAPHSSLAHMLGAVASHTAASPPRFLGQLATDGSWTLDVPTVLAELEAIAHVAHPILLAGTAFGFVHLLDQLCAEKRTLHLPPGSRIMETGGYKGRSRTLPKPALHQLLSRHFQVPTSHIVSEYGMCELSSQAYDHIAGHPSREPAERWFRFPPWARAILLDPESGRETSEGAVGILAIVDLANVASVLALETEDLAIRHSDTFELVGRAATAEPRGCSLLHA